MGSFSETDWDVVAPAKTEKPETTVEAEPKPAEKPAPAEKAEAKASLGEFVIKSIANTFFSSKKEAAPALTCEAPPPAAPKVSAAASP